MLNLWTAWLDLARPALDRLLGWLLVLPRDLSLLALTMLTVAVLLLVRIVLVNRQTMTAIRQDQRTLRKLAASARASGDLVALHRHRLNRGRVAAQKLFTELPAVLIGLVIFSTILHWGSINLTNLPLQARTPFEFTLEIPASNEGAIVHLTPHLGLVAEDGWVKQIKQLPSTRISQASWRLTAEPGTYHLRIHLRREVLEHLVVVDGVTPSPETRSHDPLGTTRIQLAEYHPAGVIGSLGRCPSWLIGFLFLIVPVYFGTKRLLQVP